MNLVTADTYKHFPPWSRMNKHVFYSLLWSLYWPERADGHLRCGSGQTCSLLCDPHWCKWRPGETASPPLCRYRGWEQVQLALVRHPLHTHTGCEWIVILDVVICPWWQVVLDRSQKTGPFYSEVCSLVFAFSRGIDFWNQNRTAQLKWSQGQSLFDGRELIFVNGCSWYLFNPWNMQSSKANRTYVKTVIHYAFSCGSNIKAGGYFIVSAGVVSILCKRCMSCKLN